MKHIIHHTRLLVAALAAVGNATAGHEPDPEREHVLAPLLPAESPATQTPGRVLVYNRAQYPIHNVSMAWALDAITLIGQRTGAYTVEATDDPARLSPESLRNVNAVVLNSALLDAYGDAETARKALASLTEFVASGGGLVALHASTVFGGTVTGAEGDRFREMIGGAMSSHPWEGGEPLTVRIEDPAHPLAAGFGGRETLLLPFPDEIFEISGPFSRQRSRVLVSLDLRETPDKGTKPDKDYPIVWIHPFGRGRVWVNTLGHYPSVYQDRMFVRALRDGMLFATGHLAAETTPRPAPRVDLEERFRPIFNGRNLDGWRVVGRPGVWRVEQGAIVGINRPGLQISENQFLAWEGGQPGDFELKAEFQMEGAAANSGIYFRARERRPGESTDLLVGPQADMSMNGWWTGVVMEYQLREKLAERGHKTHIDDTGRVNTWQADDPARLLAAVDREGWNTYHVIARGNLVLLRINDIVMSEVRDHDPRRPTSGLIALQVHVGEPMTVRFRNIRIREFDRP